MARHDTDENQREDDEENLSESEKKEPETRKALGTGTKRKLRKGTLPLFFGLGLIGVAVAGALILSAAGQGAAGPSLSSGTDGMSTPPTSQEPSSATLPSTVPVPAEPAYLRGAWHRSEIIDAFYGVGDFAPTPDDGNDGDNWLDESTGLVRLKIDGEWFLPTSEEGKSVSLPISRAAASSTTSGSASSSKPEPIVYKVTFHANGGNFADGSTRQSVAIQKGFSVTIPFAQRSHYALDHWRIGSGGNAGLSGSRYYPDGDADLYAAWTPIKIKVSYQVEGKIVKESPEVDWDASRDIKLWEFDPKAVDPGISEEEAAEKKANFVGWYPDWTNSNRIESGKLGDIPDSKVHMVDKTHATIILYGNDYFRFEDIGWGEVRMLKYLGDEKNVYVPDKAPNPKGDGSYSNVTQIGNGVNEQSLDSEGNPITLPPDATMPPVWPSPDRGGFADNQSIETVRIPDAIWSIGQGTFMGCKNLVSLNFPSRLRDIGPTAFAGTESITQVVLSENVSHVYAYAFSQMPKLEKVFIPNSVDTIDDHVFSDEGDDSPLTIYCEDSGKQGWWDDKWNFRPDGGQYPVKWNAPRSEFYD